MTRRFVAGNRLGELQSMTGETARQFHVIRKCGSPGWWKSQYPIIYELVPISLDQVNPKAKEVKGGG